MPVFFSRGKLMNTNWLKVSLGYFLAIAIMGTLLRFGFFIGYFPVNSKYLLHTHSHIAFLGWIYPVLFIAIVNNFLEKKQIIKGNYKLQFIITQVILGGMLISFLIQGYGTVSISLSTIFQFLTYWFAYSFYRDLKDNKYIYSVKFIKTGLIAMVISTFGTWGLAVIGAKGMGGSPLYELAIYFYLHFQYNGWFTFTILGLLINLIERNNITFSKKYAVYSYKLLTFSLFPAYFLSVLGKSYFSLINFTAFFAGVIQLIGAICFLAVIFKIRNDLSILFNGAIKQLMSISVISFLLKNILQLFSVLPLLAELAFNNRYVIIAYIHMVFIGFISFFLFGYLSHLGWYSLNSTIAKTGSVLLVIGFLATEILLITPTLSILIPELTFLIFLFSTVMVTGISLFLFMQLNFIFEREKTGNLQTLKTKVFIK